MPDIALRETAILAFAALLLAAAMWDALSYRIPNLLCLALLALWPFYISTLPVADLTGALLAAGIVFAFGCLAWFRGWMGGGDVKLTAIVALWAGWPDFLATFFVISIAGGLLALAMKTPARRIFGMAATPATDIAPAITAPVLPYGIAIACCGLFLAWRLLSMAA
jgi:prepilin peptidase CpaA